MNILLPSALVFNLITSLSCPIVNKLHLTFLYNSDPGVHSSLGHLLCCSLETAHAVAVAFCTFHAPVSPQPPPPKVLRGCCYPCGTRELVGGRGSVWRLVSEPLAPDTQTVLRGPLWMWQGCRFVLGLNFCVVLSQGCRRAGLCTPTRQRSRGRASASAQSRWRPSCRSSRGLSGLTSWNSRESGKGCPQDGAGVRPWRGKQGHLVPDQWAGHLAPWLLVPAFHWE